jgi:hypothetical protein
MKCTFCGWKNPTTVFFCRRCGVQLINSSSGILPVPFPTTDVLASKGIERAPRAKQGRAWRFIWIILVCLLIGGAGIAWWMISASQSTTAISQTLQTYCSALQQGNYQQAYNQWVGGTQMSESDFAYTQKSKAQTTNCEINNISAANVSAQATLTLFYADGSSAVDQVNLVLANGVWKIKGQSLS